MVIKGIDSIDLDLIYPGYTVELKIVDQDMVTSLIETAELLGCKLISLKYGHFYFREYLSNQRSDIIDNLLSDN